MTSDERELGSDLEEARIEGADRRELSVDSPEGLAASEDRPELWERIGKAYFDAGDFEHAIDSLERVVSADEATVETYRRLSESARQLGRSADEVRYREAALDRCPEDAALWRDLGIARRRAGSAREGVASLREAVRLDPGDATGSSIELGRALREAGDARGAVETFREALRLRPGSSELWSDLAEVYSEMGLFAESDQAVREAIRLKPANASAWHTIATNSLKRGARDTAARAYQRMKELNPDFADEILSWVSYTAGLPPSALGETPPMAPAAAAAKRRGRLLPFRRLRA
jgi:tetratricopeptide (TPR) repeat protein